MNIMHELLHGILKDRMSLLSSHSQNSVPHDILICRENKRAERKFQLVGNAKRIPPTVHVFRKKNILVKTIIIIPTIATLDPSNLYSDFKFLRHFHV